MRNISPHSKLWQYLNSTGVLESGNEEAIMAVKRSYRKKYLLEYKRKQRNEKPGFTVMLSRENGEYYNIFNAAKRHSMPVTTFLKKATLAYLSQRFIVPDRRQLSEVEQLLSECLNEIQRIARQKERFNWDREQKYEAIEKRILKLERQIGEVFRNPTLLPNHDNQNQIPQGSEPR